MNIKIQSRDEVSRDLTWDLTAIYQTEGDYLNDLNALPERVATFVKNYKGQLTNSQMIHRSLDDLKEILQTMGLTGNYANLALSVDQGDIEAQGRYTKLRGIQADLASQLSFVKSELIALDEEVLVDAINARSDHAIYLKEILEDKPHALHAETERVLSALSQTLNAPYTIYNQTKLLDMAFEPFVVAGKEYPISFNLFEDEWEFESNVDVRREAFKTFSEKLREYQHTTAAVYHTHVQKEKTMAQLRGFDSVIDYLLFDQKVERELYDRQIDLIMEELAPHMRKYAKLLQRIHKLDEMTFADLKIDVDPTYEPKVSLDQAQTYLVEALSCLGEDYTDMVKRSFTERWTDFAQNKGKSTGAFCASPYGAHPYILLTWSGKMREVLTLAHELGHAGHFYMSHQHQNILNTRPSLYFIEAPSTMNEMLMANHLLKSDDSPRFKRWVLATLVGKTYYHNFVTHLLEAAYQRDVYQHLEQGGSLHAQLLNKMKRDVLEAFWGDAVDIVEGAELTWMRQPHYYMGLYPYTYSAGLTIATEVSQRILSEGQPAIDDWRKVLNAGGTKPAVELAKMAKVDVTTDHPLRHTIKHIGEMIDEIIRLTDIIDNQ